MVTVLPSGSLWSSAPLATQLEGYDMIPGLQTKVAEVDLRRQGLSEQQNLLLRLIIIVVF